MVRTWMGDLMKIGHRSRCGPWSAWVLAGGAWACHGDPSKGAGGDSAPSDDTADTSVADDTADTATSNELSLADAQAEIRPDGVQFELGDSVAIEYDDPDYLAYGAVYLVGGSMLERR